MIDDITTPVDTFLGEDPQEQAERLARVRLQAERATDPSLPVWRAASGSGPGIEDMDMHQGRLDALDTTLRGINPAPCPDRPHDPFHVEVMVRWARYAARMRLLPEDDQDWKWEWLKCWAAPVVGAEGWLRFVTELAHQQPACPLDINIDGHAVREAHRSCGWPTGLSWLTSGMLDYCLDGNQNPPPKWVKCCALLTVLKYTRAPLTNADAYVLMHGQAHAVVNGGKIARATPFAGVDTSKLAGALGCSLGGTKAKPKPWADAVKAALSCLSREELIQLAPTVDAQTSDPRLLILPGAGWHPFDTTAARWIQHGLSVYGLHRVDNGTVKPAHPNDGIITSHLWGPTDPAQVSTAEAAMPTSYRVELPSTKIQRAFTNAGAVGNDAQAYWSLVDAMVLVGVAACPSAALEKPLALCMPTDVDPDRMTNTGKSTLALALARAFAPSIQMALRAGTDTPAQRALGAELYQHGTACVDEFVLSTTGVLAENNLFSLCAGQGIMSGKLFSDTGTVMRLKAPLCMSVKVVDARPDLYNRSVVLRLAPFVGTTSGKTRVALETGNWSFDLRFSCLDFWDNHDLAAVADEAASAGAPTNGWRWPVHRYVAAALLDNARTQAGLPVLTEDEILAKIDRAAADMHAWMDSHAGRASDLGIDLTRALPRLSMSQLVGNLPPDVLKQALPPGEFRSTKQILDVLRQQYDDDPVRLSGALGVSGKPTPRALSRALGSSIRSIPDEGVVLDSGAKAVRGKLKDGYMTVSLDYTDLLVIVDDIQIPGVPAP